MKKIISIIASTLTIFIACSVMPTSVQGESFAIEARSFGKNISRGDTAWFKDYFSASPGQEIRYKMLLENIGDEELRDINVKIGLDKRVIYKDHLEINGSTTDQNPVDRAINIGNLEAGGTTSLTFDAQIDPYAKFGPSENKLIATFLAYNDKVSDSDSFKVKVNPTVTQINTGITSTLLDSLLLPAAMSIFLVWIFKSQIIGIDMLVEKRRDKIREFRAKKRLRRRIKSLKKRGAI